MLVDASKLDVNASVRGAAAAGAGGNLIVDEFEAVWAQLEKQGDGEPLAVAVAVVVLLMLLLLLLLL